MQKLAEPSLAGIEEYLLDVLGDDPANSRPTKYIEALEGIGINGIRQLIVILLENGIPKEMIESSYFHPNKFFKLGICRLSNRVKLRMHFWDKDHLEVQTPVHSHAWDFASMLICGSYVHNIFRVTDLDEDALALIEKYKNSNSILKIGSVESVPDNYLGKYKIPKRDVSLGKFQPQWEKYVKAERISSKIERQGSVYFLGMEFPHQIKIDLKEVGSMITLVLTSETDRDNVFTFQPITQPKKFDNPSPNVDGAMVKLQLERILSEINKISND
ncbi:MAG: hypothetical protein H0W50_03615 [Parachlamydiaceae bacterium]|nr:hypothetical protein [Parachlamydiaceae bacterium]